MKTKVVNSILEINDDLLLLLMDEGLNHNIIKKLDVNMKELNQDIDYIGNQSKIPVKTNVAIAAAITALARVDMMEFKNMKDVNIYYTDTDSVIIDKPIKTGNEIGELKDELEGGIIEKGIFLGAKKYALKIRDSNNNLIVKTIFSGVKRNSLT
jgi:hypothetical protein